MSQRLFSRLAVKFVQHTLQLRRGEQRCLRAFASSAYYPSRGDFAVSEKRRFCGKDVLAFAQLTGDCNPLHTDPEYPSRFGQPIVHGMLVASLIPALFAQCCPGSIYLSQNVKFLSPVYLDDYVHARIDVSRVRRVSSGDNSMVLVCDTYCFAESESPPVETASAKCRSVIKGEAVVLLPPNLALNGFSKQSVSRD